MVAMMKVAGIPASKRTCYKYQLHFA